MSTVSLSLISHTNTGKTTLARTLLGRDVGSVRDAQVIDAANRLVVGVDESAILKWLLKNRQKAGIRREYREAQSATPPVTTQTPVAPE